MTNDTKAEREPGWYWVRCRAADETEQPWEIATYDAHGWWVVDGELPEICNFGKIDHSFAEIDERRITRAAPVADYALANAVKWARAVSEEFHGLPAILADAAERSQPGGVTITEAQRREIAEAWRALRHWYGSPAFTPSGSSAVIEPMDRVLQPILGGRILSPPHSGHHPTTGAEAMTPTHPAPSLAEAILSGIKAAYDEYRRRRADVAAEHQSLSDQDVAAHIARAVAAWLARPETVERIQAIVGAEGYYVDNDALRAAIAAVVGEAGNG